MNDFDEIRHGLLGSNTRKALTFAKLRTSSLAELIELVFEDPVLGNFPALSALKEKEINPEEKWEIARLAGMVLSDDFRSSLPARFRSRTDRFLLHMCGIIDDESLRLLARQQAFHRLKDRRKTAVKSLRRVGLEDDDVPILRSQFLDYGDRDSLVYMSLVENAFDGIHCCELIGNSSLDVESGDANYRESRVMERLVLDEKIDLSHAAERHPVPLIRAIGRIGSQKLEDQFVAALQGVQPEVFPLAVSVAGRVSKTALDAVIVRLNEFDSTITLSRDVLTAREF